jgi:hypothetical protein
VHISMGTNSNFNKKICFVNMCEMMTYIYLRHIECHHNRTQEYNQTSNQGHDK